MLRFLLALAASFGLAALIAVTQRVVPAVGRAWRAAIIAAASLLALLGVAIGVAGLEYDAWWAAIVGAVILVMSLRLGWSARRPGRHNGSAAGLGRNGLPSTADLADPRWRSLERQLGSRDRERARRAQLAIRGFLAERRSPALTSAHQSLLLSLDKRVPELIDACLDRCRGARSSERAHYLDTTLQRLEQIAGEAEIARKEVRAADDQRLEVLHRYFDGVAEPSRSEVPRP